MMKRLILIAFALLSGCGAYERQKAEEAAAMLREQSIFKPTLCRVTEKDGAMELYECRVASDGTEYVVTGAGAGGKVLYLTRLEDYLADRRAR